MPAVDAVECPHCATRIRIKSDSILGKKVKCPKCSEPFVAKAPSAGTPKTSGGSATNSSEPVVVACPHCAAKFRMNPTALGKSRTCPKCDEEFTPRAVKSAASKSALAKSKAPKESDDDSHDDNFLKSLSAATKDSRTADAEEEPEDDSEGLTPQRSKSKSVSGKKKKKSSSSGGGGIPGILGWVVGGAIGGGVGAAIWAAVGYFSGFEVGWIAWGVGFLTGMGTGVAAAANNEQGAGSGITAAVISILAVLAGKYAVMHLIMEKILGQLPAEARQAAEAAKGDIFLSSFGPYDLLWFFLAAGTAFKLGSGQQGDD